MQSTIISSLIDPTDTNVSLIDAYDIEQKFWSTTKPKSILDEHRRPIYVKSALWMVFNGYLPRNAEWSLVNGKRQLTGWNTGDLYLNSRHLERHGMPSFPIGRYYCNILGHDLENDLEAWEATADFMAIKETHRAKIVDLINAEASALYKLANFPTTDEGPLGLLIRLQDMFMGMQRRVIAANTTLELALNQVTKLVPKDSDGIRNQESLMRKLVALEERSRYDPIGSRDTYWGNIFLKNLLRAGAQGDYINDATRSHTTAKLLALQNYNAQGQPMTMAMIWQAISIAFTEINGGECESVSVLLSSVIAIAPPSRILLTQGRPPLTDSNGRPQVRAADKPSPALELEEATKLIADLKAQVAARDNTIAQSKIISERFKTARKENWEKKKREREDTGKREDLGRNQTGRYPPRTASAGADAHSQASAQANLVRGKSGYLLRTSPDSDDDDSDMDAPRARIKIARVQIEPKSEQCLPYSNAQGVAQDQIEADAPQSPLAPTSQPKDEPRILSTRELYLRFGGYDILPGRVFSILDPDIPQLLDVDSDDEPLPPLDMMPKWKDAKDFRFVRAVHCNKVVHEDSTLILINESTYLMEDNKIYPIEFLIRGPRRPTQRIMELHAMHHYGLPYSINPSAAWTSHCNDPAKQAHRTAVILRAADVAFDYTATNRECLLARISDVAFPELPPCDIYGTAVEYEEYAAAGDLASGSGWPTYLAQRCQERFYANLKNILVPMEVPNHTFKLHSDARYWYQYSQTYADILRLYTNEINHLEKAMTHQTSFTMTLVSIGVQRRRFNYSRGIQTVPPLDDEEFGRQQYAKTGIPNPFADVFYVHPEGQTIKSSIGGVRTVKLHSPPTIPASSQIKTSYYPNIYGGPPDWVAVPEGYTEPASHTMKVSSQVQESTDLTIPEGCLTVNLVNMVNGEPGTTAASGPEEAGQMDVPAPPGV